jgi:glycosyltransferase involved in cell wall biosynthesis
MKILHIIPTLHKGGAERLVLDICIELSKRKDIDVRLITFSEENNYTFLSREIRHEVIPSKVVPSISGKPVVEIDALIKYISDFKPDIIHSHLFEVEMVSRWKLFAGVKYFSHCHDNMPQLRNVSFKDIFHKNRITELYEKKLLLRKYKECNNHFIAISKHTQLFFMNALPAPLRNNVLFLHNAIDYNRFHIPHIKSEVLSFVNVGGFVAKKNQKFFIPLAKELIKNKIEFKIILLGDGPLRNDFIEEMKTNHLDAYFELPGNVDNVEDYYAKAKIYIHAATYEPFGLVLLEAMAAGLPVVCLDGGGNRDIIEDGKNGFMINENDPVLFAGKIMKIIQDEEMYQQMRDFAEKFACRNDIKDYTDKLLDLYSASL